MARREDKRIFPQSELRSIAWEMGHRYPIPPSGDYISMVLIHPRHGYVHWHVSSTSAGTGDEVSLHGRSVVRIYDITDIIFDGYNAHMFFDLPVYGLSGNYYFTVNRLARNYISEIGIISGNGTFTPMARSNTVYFDLDRPSGNYQTAGLFVGGALKRTFPVENIFDAPIYERMNRETRDIRREEELSPAVVFIDTSEKTSPLGSFIMDVSDNLIRFGVAKRLFTPAPGIDTRSATLMKRMRSSADKVRREIKGAHGKRRLDLIHCHEWPSMMAGLDVSRELELPLIFSLHSTEYERAQGHITSRLSSEICSWEQKGIDEAHLVIVPHSSTRHQVIDLYHAGQDKVVIIPDAFVQSSPETHPGPSELRQWFGLDQTVPVVLFAGEVSHSAGADLLMDAVPTVCRNFGSAHFVFVGDGPLRGELEAHAYHAGLGHRCRFTGDISKETFEAMLAASDFVVIPARTWQGEGLAQMALRYGKPVLTTHQAGITCIKHGQNGLITFDNPGSIVWGLQELLANPLRGNMAQLAVKGRTGQPSLEAIAVQYYMYYEIILRKMQEVDIV